MTHGYAFVAGILAVWRITYALTMEDGPARVLVRLRAGVGRWTSVLDCFYCTSIWTAVPVALALGATLADRMLLWLALSGGACLAHRFTERSQTGTYWEEQEDDHVLRRRADGTGTAADSH